MSQHVTVRDAKQATVKRLPLSVRLHALSTPDTGQEAG